MHQIGRAGENDVNVIPVPLWCKFRQQAHCVPGHGLPGARVEPAHRDAANEVMNDIGD